MPSWMRPSGTFGIGFQSIFLIADNKVTVKTQKYGKEETLILELYNPAGKENGAILVKRLKDSLINCGTEISFDVKLSKDFDYSVNCRDKFAIKEICSYDFVKSDSFDYLAGKICDEIYNFSKMSHIPIQFVYKEEEQTLVSKCNFKNCFYDPETGLSVSLQCMSDNVKMGLYYRNQYVENFNLELPFLNFCINILDGDAKNILTLNRNDVQSSAEYKLRQNIIKSTCRLLIDLIGKDCNEIKEKKTLVDAYLLTNELFVKKETDFKIGNEWENINIMSSDGTSYTIGKLLNAQKVTCIHHSSIHFRLNDKLVIINDFECNNKEELLIFLRYVLHTRFKWFMYSLEGIVFTKDKIEDIIKDDVLTYEKWYKELLYSHPLSARKVMPCLDKYKELEVDIHSGDFTFSGYGLTYPKMIEAYPDFQ